MRSDALDRLTGQWFMQRALIGVAAGYVMRVLEHIIWASDKRQGQSRADEMRFALMNIPQCALIGSAFGYVVVALIAYFLQSRAVIDVCSYGVPALTSFLAVDIRDFVRRMSKLF